jgi:hypothetical protein
MCRCGPGFRIVYPMNSNVILVARYLRASLIVTNMLVASQPRYMEGGEATVHKTSCSPLPLSSSLLTATKLRLADILRPVYRKIWNGPSLSSSLSRHSCSGILQWGSYHVSVQYCDNFGKSHLLLATYTLSVVKYVHVYGMTYTFIVIPRSDIEEILVRAGQVISQLQLFRKLKSENR